MEDHAGVGVVGVGVEVVDAVGVEGAGAADDAVDFVAFGEQEFGEVAAVLAGDAGDQCSIQVVLPQSPASLRHPLLLRPDALLGWSRTLRWVTLPPSRARRGSKRVVPARATGDIMARPSKLRLLRDRRFIAQFVRQLASDAFDRREVIHFLHIGKNAGSHVWRLAAQVNRSQTRLRFKKQGHEKKLIDIPRMAQYFFCTRDPVTRFVSSFHQASRRRPTGPRTNVRRSRGTYMPSTLPNISHFHTKPSGHDATKANRRPRTQSMNQRDWFDRAGRFSNSRTSPPHRARLESFEDDIARLFEKLGLDPRPILDAGRTRVGTYTRDDTPPSHAVCDR